MGNQGVEKQINDKRIGTELAAGILLIGILIPHSYAILKL